LTLSLFFSENKSIVFSLFSHERQGEILCDLIFLLSGGRAMGAIIGIISACGLFFILVACCIVYYRRHLRQKG
jgi:hypothetical protein